MLEYVIKYISFLPKVNDDMASKREPGNVRLFVFQMHVVLYNTRYEDFSSAVFRPKGLQVLAFMFTVSRIFSNTTINQNINTC